MSPESKRSKHRSFGPEGNLIEAVFGGYDHYGNGRQRSEISDFAQVARKKVVDTMIEDSINSSTDLPERKGGAIRKNMEVLKVRYGLDGNGGATLREVGERFGVTRQVIQTRESSGLWNLRHSSYRSTLLFFVPYAEGSIARNMGVTCEYDILRKFRPDIDVPALDTTIVDYLFNVPPAAQKIGSDYTTLFAVLAKDEGYRSQIIPQVVLNALLIIKEAFQPDSPKG